MGSLPATDWVALWRLTQRRRLKMPQQPLGGGGPKPEVASLPANGPSALLFEQRADMVIRLPWRPVGRLTSISMLASSGIVAYLAASSSFVDFSQFPEIVYNF